MTRVFFNLKFEHLDIQCAFELIIPVGNPIFWTTDSVDKLGRKMKRIYKGGHLMNAGYGIYVFGFSFPKNVTQDQVAEIVDSWRDILKSELGEGNVGETHEFNYKRRWYNLHSCPKLVYTKKDSIRLKMNDVFLKE